MPCIKTTPKHIISFVCTELDDSNPLESRCSSTSAVVEGSTTTVDDMAEATEEVPPPPLQNKEKVQSAQSVDDQGMY